MYKRQPITCANVLRTPRSHGHPPSWRKVVNRTKWITATCSTGPRFLRAIFLLCPPSYKSRARACTRADAHALLVQEKKVIFATCFTTPRKKVSARARVFSPLPKSTFLLSHTPSSHNTAHKLAGEYRSQARVGNISCFVLSHPLISP